MERIKKAKEGFEQFKNRDFNFKKNHVMADALGVKSGIAIDHTKRYICILSRDSDYKPFYKLVPFKDILVTEIYEDGQTITQTSRMSQAGGAMIGALMLGGIGAIIGGLSGKQTSSNEISEIDLRLTINDVENPIYDINFLDTSTTRSSELYKNTMKEVRTWYATLHSLIEKLDEMDSLDSPLSSENKTTKFTEQNNTTLSLSNEITKLAKLKEQSIITSEEFIQMKAKLLED